MSTDEIENNIEISNESAIMSGEEGRTLYMFNLRKLFGQQMMSNAIEYTRDNIAGFNVKWQNQSQYDYGNEFTAFNGNIEGGVLVRGALSLDIVCPSKLGLLRFIDAVLTQWVPFMEPYNEKAFKHSGDI